MTRCESCASLARPAISTIVNSINPDRIAGQKTAAFEIIDEMGDAPDFHLLPVGNAGNITAYWAGYREFHAQGRSTTLPAMIGFQAAGAAPIFLQPGNRKPGNYRLGDSDRKSSQLATGPRGHRGITRRY